MVPVGLHFHLLGWWVLSKDIKNIGICLQICTFCILVHTHFADYNACSLPVASWNHTESLTLSRLPWAGFVPIYNVTHSLQRQCSQSPLWGAFRWPGPAWATFGLKVGWLKITIIALSVTYLIDIYCITCTISVEYWYMVFMLVTDGLQRDMLTHRDTVVVLVNRVVGCHFWAL